MNEWLRYEEQLAAQWSSATAGNDFTLPDENLAWADMRRRLDDEEEKRPFAWWKWGCLGWALLGIVAVGTGWYLLQPKQWFSKGEVNENRISIQRPSADSAKQQGKAMHSLTGRTTAVQEKEIHGVYEKAKQFKQEKQIKNDKQPDPVTDLNPLIKKTGINILQSVNGKKQKKPEAWHSAFEVTAANKRKPENKQESIGKNQTISPILDTIQIENNSFQQVTGSPTLNIRDTAQVNQKDTIANQKPLPQKDSVKINPVKKEKRVQVKDNTPFLFSAGFGLHQQVPIAGQTITPYSSLGRKASLADYLPSVYLRFEKDKKWFLQGEFRYGAPQYTKQFMYRQQLVPDTGSNPQYSTLTSYGLKKTFYHQLPITFQYFILPEWSLGAGMQWNLFKSAIAEKEVNRKNNFTQVDSLVSRSIFKEEGAGTLFRKSYWQAVVETQYKKNRLSFGARYAFGLQPYIRFTLPGQPVKEERNHALQVFIRYEVWRQQK